MFVKILKKIWQDIWALMAGAVLSYWFVYMMMSPGLFTADLMNQYGEVVTSLSWSEMLYDISTWWQITVKTTKDYQQIKKMILIMYFDQESVSINTENVQSNYEFEINKSDNTVIFEVSMTWDILWDTPILSFGYEGKDARWIQEKSVFIAMADTWQWEPEDLVVFTNTPTNPNPPTDKMRE